MSQRATRSRLAAAVVTLVLVAGPTAPLRAAAKPALGGATPRELLARVRAAAEKDDFRELVACMAPDSLNTMAGGLVLGSSMMVAMMGMGGEMGAAMAEGASEATGEDAAKQKAAADKVRAEAQKQTAALKARHEAILDKYGLSKAMEKAPDMPAGTSPEDAMAKLLVGVDKRALVVDLMDFMDSMPGTEKKSNKTGPLAGTVTDLKIDGDHATAKAGADTVRMVRIDGRWLLEMDKSSDAPPTP